VVIFLLRFPQLAVTVPTDVPKKTRSTYLSIIKFSSRVGKSAALPTKWLMMVSPS